MSFTLHFNFVYKNRHEIWKATYVINKLEKGMFVV